MDICDTSYYDDVISETLLGFYDSCDRKSEIKKIIDLYISDKVFFNYIQKNFLVNRVSIEYLIRLYNDFDTDNIVDEYDYITNVNTTRWI